MHLYQHNPSLLETPTSQIDLKIGYLYPIESQSLHINSPNQAPGLK